MATASSGVAPPVHVLLPAAILERSPSLQDGITADVERAHRFFGCEVIQEAGVLLRLPQVVMATAQTMLHRFFYRKSLRDFDAFRVAFSCLFLAAKVEERPKRIKDVLSVFYALYRRRKCGKSSAKQQLLDLEGGTYCLWRDWLVIVERQILIDLGFSLYNVTEHPHKYILYYIKIIGGSKELAQKAWGYINDSLRIDLCVRYKSEVIACAAIFLASRFLQIKLPDDPHWYALFDVDRRALHDASIAIMELYRREKVLWLEPLTEVNPFATDDNTSGSRDEDDEEDSGSPVETERLVERTIAGEDNDRALPAVAAEIAVEALAIAVLTGNGATIEAAVARSTDEEMVTAAAAAVEDAAVEAERRSDRRMALVMDEEAAYDDALIDEFDAPEVLLNVTPARSHTQQRQQQQLPHPLVSAQSLRHQPTLTQAPLVADPWETARLAGALYPSFEELGGGGVVRHASGNSALFSTPTAASPYGTVATQPPPSSSPLLLPPQQQLQVQYPSVDLNFIQTEPRGENLSRDHEYTATRALYSSRVSANPIRQSTLMQPTPPRAEPTEPSLSFRSPADPVVVHQQERAPVEEPEILPTLSQHEFEVKQKEIAQELRGYEQQLDYLAHALAGDTPHQKEERKRRELERQEREHQRLVAMENRVQHQIERAHERELRRVKVLERAHRASRSSSPENRRERESRDEEEGENVEPHEAT